MKKHYSLCLLLLLPLLGWGQDYTFKVTKATDPDPSLYVDADGKLDPTKPGYAADFAGTLSWAVRSVNEVAETESSKIIFELSGEDVIDLSYSLPAVRRKLHIDGRNIINNQKVRLNGDTTARQVFLFVTSTASGAEVRNLHVSVGYTTYVAGISTGPGYLARWGAGIEFDNNVDNIIVDNCVFSLWVGVLSDKLIRLLSFEECENIEVTNNRFGVDKNDSLIGYRYWHGLNLLTECRNARIGNDQSDGNIFVNCQQAIHIAGGNPSYNLCKDQFCIEIQGNKIGTIDGVNVAEEVEYGIDFSKKIINGALIGGDSKLGQGNIIYVSKVPIMFFQDRRNQISNIRIVGNQIGKEGYTDAAFGTATDNWGGQPWVEDVQIGDASNLNYANDIAADRGFILDTLYNKITISGNNYYGIPTDSIIILKGGNSSLAQPTIQAINNQALQGISIASATIELYTYADNNIFYQGSTTADENGNWTYTESGNLASAYVAVAIDKEGNTSAFSAVFEVSADDTPPTLEAECATIGSNWQEVISAQASGGKYVTYPNGSYITAPSENPADQLVYTVSVNEAQNYFLMARINAPSYGDDSFWFKMDDNDWIRWSSGITVNKGFQWNLAPGGPFSLSAGTHTLRIAYREDGIQLDKLTLSPTNTLPTGLGEEAQACADDYTPPAPPTVNNPPDATVAPTVSGTLTPPSQSNSNVNYVRSFTPRTQIESPEDVTMSSNKNDVSISTEYLDGLGRPIQTVVRAGGGRSSRDEDLVQPVAYDAYGRQVKEYLPYAANNATGAYRPNAPLEQYQFYTSTGPSDIAKSDYPYAERQYEASPLNRVLRQAAPGENWRLGSGHEVEMQYLVNTTNEVRQWTASNNLSVAALSGGTTYYGVGELYKTVTVDENDHTTTEFVNKEGQTVLKRVQGPDGDQDTYYVYDDFNLLRFVLPPEASKQLGSNTAQASNTAFVEQQLYVYTYDGRRRMTSKQVPGGGITRMVYDRWDRLVLTQSPRMRQDNNKQWLYTKYDNLNRPIVTGIYTASQDESDLRTAVMNATGHHERFITSDLNYTLNESFPVTTGTTARTVTYYDDYAFTHARYGNFSAQGTPHRSQVQGQVTGTRVRQLGNRDWLQSVTYYDEQQRPILHLQRNHLGATDRRKTTYRNAVNSEVVATEFKHKTTLAEHTVRQRYLHDHQGRLKRTWHRLDNESEVVLSTQSYNALGSVGSKALHVSSGSARQNINYRYNIRGWLTHINDLNQAGSYFNQELYYDFGFDKKQHNGNIAGVKWNRAGSKSHAYGYLYDEVNRITGADYRDRAAGSWASAPGAFSVDKVGYDENGNIEQLKRYGLLDERLHLLDDLSYTYQGNRLRAVQDAGEAGAGFVDGAKATDEYRYDQAGNLISDKNKNITGIAYDPVLNLPLRIDFANGSRLEYVYDATGTKLQQKVVQVGGKSSLTDYVQGFHYEDNKLSFLRHDEGRLMMEDRAYHYDLKDHLGNSRVTFSSKPVTTTAMASMEMSAAPEEEAVFEGVAESRQTLAFHNTTDPSIQEPEPQQVATLMPGEQGPSKSLQVYQGDTVRLKVNARYETTPQQVQGLEGVATEVVGAVEKTASGLESSGVSEGVSGLGATGALANDQQEVPQAYLNYLVYDEDYQLIDQGFVAVSEAAAVGAKNPDAVPEELALEVPIEEDGFVYAYLSNGVANSGMPAHFDDFTVEQQSYIVQVDDFYPFGASFDQNQNRVLANKYLYQDQELQNDLGLNWYHFKWRIVDPLANKIPGWSPYAFVFDNPVRYIDPDGRMGVDPIKPFTRSDLSRLADNAGLTGGSTIVRNRIIGSNFEQDVLMAGNLEKNTTAFGSFDRQAEYGISTVIPDNVGTSVSSEGEAFPNSAFIEVKATGRVSRSSSRGQTLGLLDALSESPAAEAGAVPALILVTTADTKVGRSTTKEANARGVAVFQVKTFTNEDGNLSFGPAQLLTNPTVTNDDGTRVNVPATFRFPGKNNVQPNVQIDRGLRVNPTDPDQINFNPR